MNTKLKSLLFLLIFFIVSLSQLTYAQSRTVAKVNNIQNITIPNGNVGEYINKFLDTDAITIEGMKVEQYEQKYYLLAQRYNDAWIYIIPLKQKGNKLYISRKRVLNACEAKDFNINNFNIINSEDIYCNDCNHKIMQRSIF